MERLGFETVKRINKKYNNIYAEYNGRTFRSQLEYRFAQMLDWWKKLGVIKDWVYEPERMTFEHTDAHGKRADKEYWPDFLVQENDGSRKWYETKGYVENSDLLKWKLFKRHYPKEYLCVVFAKKLRPGKGKWGISVNKYERMKQIVDRIWDDAEKEFKKYRMEK